MTTPLRRGVPVIAGGFAAVVLAVVAAPFVGSTDISFARVFSTTVPFADNVDAQIFFIARLPRALAASLVGGTLAAAGVVFQGLLRNAHLAMHHAKREGRNNFQRFSHDMAARSERHAELKILRWLKRLPRKFQMENYISILKT